MSLNRIIGFDSWELDVNTAGIRKKQKYLQIIGNDLCCPSAVYDKSVVI